MGVDLSQTGKRSSLAALAAAALALAAAGCGEKGEPGAEETETAISAAQAVTETGAVRQGLQAGLAAYRKGDAQVADQRIGDAYLEHFELVEGPLGDLDPELNEDLEVLISTTIRDQIKANAAVPKVAALVGQAQSDLDRAGRVLQGY